MRDFDKNPYTVDEDRVATWLCDLTGIGGGDDPIGFLIASHGVLSYENNRYKEALKLLKENLKKEGDIQDLKRLFMLGVTMGALSVREGLLKEDIDEFSSQVSPQASK